MLRAFTDWLRTTRWAPRIIGFMLNAGATEEWLVFNTGELYRGQYGTVIPRKPPLSAGDSTVTCGGKAASTATSRNTGTA